MIISTFITKLITAVMTTIIMAFTEVSGYTVLMVAGFVIAMNIIVALIKILWIYMYRRRCTMVMEYVDRAGYDGIYYELFNKNKPVSVRLTIEKIRFLKICGSIILASDDKNLDRQYDNKYDYGVPCRILFNTVEEFEKITGRYGMEPKWRDNVIYKEGLYEKNLYKNNLYNDHYKDDCRTAFYKDKTVCFCKCKRYDNEYQVFVTDGINNYFTLLLTDTDITELYSMHTRMDLVECGHKNYESNQFTVKLYCVKSEYDNVKKVIDRKIKFDKLM